jgi:hypothetical protein
MDQKVLHNKIKRTLDSYIEILQNCMKSIQILTKSSSHSFKRDPSYKWKDPCKHTSSPANSSNKTKIKQIKKPQNCAGSGRIRPRSGRSGPDPSTVELVAAGLPDSLPGGALGGLFVAV